MTFLQPWAAWFLAGIPVIVLLYLLRLKRREVRVSTHFFWQRVLQESSRRAFFHRLRHLWSLLLQVLIFLLIAGALAKPLWQRGQIDSAGIVLLLDTRARMNATEADGETRLQKAMATAKAIARQASSNTPIALLAIADAPRVLVPFTDDEAALGQALDRMEGTDASGDSGPGVDLANAILAGHPGGGRIVFLTDRASAGVSPEGNSRLEVHPFGTERDNVAITRFATRPHPASPETVEVLLEVQNFGKLAVRAEVELALDGRVFEVRPLAIEPNSTKLDVLSSTPRPGRGSQGWLTARLKTDDAMPGDNVAYAAHPARPPRRVLLVSEGNSFLEKLLGVDPTTRFQFIQPAAWKPGLAEKFEVVIFDRSVPPGFRWADAKGSYLFVGASPFAGKSDNLDRPLISDVSAEDPLTRGVPLQNISIQRALTLETPASDQGWKFRTPIRSFAHPLLIFGTRESQRLAVLGFDVLESDLPLRVAFPLLITQLLRELDARNAETPLALKAGETLALQAGERASDQALTTLPKSLPALQSSAFLHPLRNGFYRLGSEENTRWVAVNTFSGTESDLRIPAADKAARNSATVPITWSTPGPWPLWTWLTLGALALFTTEWWLFHRRKTE